MDVLFIVDPLLLFRLICVEFLLFPIGVGYLAWFRSSQKSCVTGKLRKSQMSCSRFVLNGIVLGSVCDTVVGQVVEEAELDEDALEIDEAVDKNDEALSVGKILKLVQLLL